MKKKTMKNKGLSNPIFTKFYKQTKMGINQVLKKKKISRSRSRSKSQNGRKNTIILRNLKYIIFLSIPKMSTLT